MEADQKNQIRSRLEEEIQQTQLQIEALKPLTAPIAPDDAIGRLSRMEALNTKSVNEHLLHKSQRRLLKLESSLSFIDQDDYGLCRSCRSPIPFGRLMMMPESDRCVDCA